MLTPEKISGEYDPEIPLHCVIGIPACTDSFGGQEFDFVISVHYRF
ncbi:MAG: hypothetical protein JW731_04770 [Bacteroidales bacterium]|nr:hypothetical protein [Bacteroidales bacterium]